MPITPVPPMAAAPLNGAVSPDPSELNASNHLRKAEFISLLNDKGGQLANPVELAAQAAKSLRGYLDRAQKAQDYASNRTRRDVSGEATPFPANQNAEMHGGPARQPFISSQADLNRIEKPAGSEQTRPVMDLEQLMNEMDVMVELERFRTESVMLASGVSATSRSINTLLKGQ